MIANTISSSFPDSKVRSFLREALFTVLGHQVVSNTFDPSQSDSVLWQVMKGSGMGMKHAGSVADLMFALKVELPLRHEHDSLGVLLWLRFRDDVFCVCKDPEASRAIRQRVQELAAPLCEVKLERFSLSWVHFLDITVFKQSTVGVSKLMFKPFVKPTARHIPLAGDSMHPRATHRSWPMGVGSDGPSQLQCKH